MHAVWREVLHSKVLNSEYANRHSRYDRYLSLLDSLPIVVVSQKRLFASQ